MIALVDLMMLASFFLAVFAILGVQLFQGSLHQRCMLTGTTVVDTTNESLCRLGVGVENEFGCPVGQYCGDSGMPFNDGVTGFDNFGQALVTIITVMTLEGWTNTVYATWETSSYYSTIYFVPLVLFVSIFLVELVTGLIYGAFLVTNAEEHDKHVMLRNMQKRKKKKVQTQSNAFF